MIVQGEGDAKRGICAPPFFHLYSQNSLAFFWCPPGNYGLVFGEGVRLAHGAWSQKGALHINAIDASNGSFPVTPRNASHSTRLKPKLTLRFLPS